VYRALLWVHVGSCVVCVSIGLFWGVCVYEALFYVCV